MHKEHIQYIIDSAKKHKITTSEVEKIILSYCEFIYLCRKAVDPKSQWGPTILANGLGRFYFKRRANKNWHKYNGQNKEEAKLKHYIRLIYLLEGNKKLPEEDLVISIYNEILSQGKELSKANLYKLIKKLWKKKK